MRVTLKDVPAQLHARLAERARRNHRSLNNEILAIIERSIEPQPFYPRSFARRVRERRERLPMVVQQEQLAKIIDDDRA